MHIETIETGRMNYDGLVTSQKRYLHCSELPWVITLPPSVAWLFTTQTIMVITTEVIFPLVIALTLSIIFGLILHREVPRRDSFSFFS